MWCADYQDRLLQWADLRDRCHVMEVEEALDTINLWWAKSPWQPYYLHWDDWRTWPNPWDLLSDNMFCSVARALGIVYTIELSKHEKIHEVSLIQTQDDNLVQVNDGKYILNCGAGELLNIHSANITIKKRIDSTKLQHLLG
jgi:hypothetical protein